MRTQQLSKENQAKQFFRLGEQYTETAKLLLNTLINNGNSNAGFGNTPEEAQQEMEKNASKSDLYLFVPAIFNCLQSTELLTKGLLLLACKTIQRSHGVEELLKDIAVSYKEDSEVYQALKEFYEYQIGIIETYKQTNSITNSYDLYMSLRYPEITLKPKEGEKKGKQITVNYTGLLCNGEHGIEQFKILLEKLERVKVATVRVYHDRC